MKIPFVNFADMESLLEKISSYDNSQTKLFASKINKCTTCGYSSFTCCSFDKNKNKHYFYRDENSMKKFCVNLNEHATEITNCEK